MSNPTIPYKIYLNETEMPKAWYNLRADMKVKPAPLLNPGTHKPMKAEELAGVFCEELIKQELDDTTPFFEIPEPIRNFYKMYRPSPLVRAYCLEEKLQTPAKIYHRISGDHTAVNRYTTFIQQIVKMCLLQNTQNAQLTTARSPTTGERAVLFPCSVYKTTHVIARRSVIVAFERTEKIIRCRCGLCEPVWLWKIE